MPSTDRGDDPLSTRSRSLSQMGTVFAAGMLLGLALISLSRLYPPGVDWEYSYAPLSEHWRDPYRIETFTNPPWLVALIPHAWLPISWGNAVNLGLNVLSIAVVIRRFGGSRWSMLMVYTSPPFLDMMRTNNIDWIPLISMLLPPTWGLPLLALKPQSLGGAALVWWKRSRNRIGLVTPLATIIIISFLLWGLWPYELKPVQHSLWNFAVWPYGIPLGLYILYRALRSDDEFAAAAATPFLVPYIAPYSITALLAFTGSRYRRQAFYVYIGFWIYFIVESRRLGLLL